MKHLCLSLLILVSLRLTAQTSWEHTWGPNYTTIYSLHKTAGKYFAATNTGLYSSADGSTWSSMTMPANTYYNNSIKHILSTGSRIWGIGYGQVMYSDDLGGTWVQDTMRDIMFAWTNGNEMYGAGYRKIFHTANGGQTWVNIPAPVISTHEFICGIVRFQGNLYTALSSGVIHRYDPASQTWQTISSQPPAGGNTYSYQRSTLYNDNDQQLYVSNTQGLFRTNADNASWQKVSPATNGNFIIDYHVSGNIIYVGYVEGLQAANKVSLGWQVIAPYRMCAALLEDGSDMYLGTSEGLQISSNYGASWKRLYRGILPIGASGEFFFNGKDLWSYSQMSPDYGNTWTTPFNDSIRVIWYHGHSVFMHQKYYYTEPNRYYVSINDGQSWQRIQLDSLTDGFAAHGKFIYSIHRNEIRRSGDGGLTFIKLKPYTCRFLVSAGNTLFMVKDDKVMKSHDDGVTWINCSVGLPPAKPGWLQWNGKILLFANIEGPAFTSADLGATWQPLPEAGLYPTIRTAWALGDEKVFMTGYNYGYRGGEVRKGIFEHKLGGSSWTVLLGDTTPWTNFMMVKDQYLFAAMTGVMRLGGVQSPTSLQQREGGQEISFFPNPCRPSETITIRGKDISHVQCYTVDGKLVKDLHFSVPAESAEIRNLSSGIYLLRIHSGETVLGGKLIVASE